MLIASPNLSPAFLTNWLYTGGSHGPFLKFENLLEWLTECRETHLLVYYKGYNKEYR